MADRRERRRRAAREDEPTPDSEREREENGNGGTGDTGVPGASAAVTDPSSSSPSGVVQVLVELHVPRADLGASALGMAAGLPGSFEVDPAYTPVEITNLGPGMKSLPEGEMAVTIRGRVSGAQLADLRANPKVIDVWPDAAFAPFRASPDDLWRRFVRPVAAPSFGVCPFGQCNCDPGTAGGQMSDVARKLGVDHIWEAGYRGDGIVVGIVDGGITARDRASASRLLDRVTAGWPTADWGTRAEWGGHGNMTATDVLGMAPEAEIYDIRIASTSIGGVISDALAGFQWAIDQHRRDGTPHILNNSWGIFQEGWDSRYARDPNHPFTRKVMDAIDEGILTLFAAGNCGGHCPDQRCGGDNGPGRSIWGANGHPRVITVGAVDLNAQFVGYSSQGPAALDDSSNPRKPDFCSITHFEGFFPCDSGTSAATPIAAGVVALLKQAHSDLTQEEAQKHLRETAKDIGPTGWDEHSGTGILRAKAAFDRIAPSQPKPQPGDPWERLEQLLGEAIELVQAQSPSQGLKGQSASSPHQSVPQSVRSAAR